MGRKRKVERILREMRELGYDVDVKKKRSLVSKLTTPITESIGRKVYGTAALTGGLLAGHYYLLRKNDSYKQIMDNKGVDALLTLGRGAKAYVEREWNKLELSARTANALHKAMTEEPTLPPTNPASPFYIRWLNKAHRGLQRARTFVDTLIPDDDPNDPL